MQTIAPRSTDPPRCKLQKGVYDPVLKGHLLIEKFVDDLLDSLNVLIGWCRRLARQETKDPTSKMTS